MPRKAALVTYLISCFLQLTSTLAGITRIEHRFPGLDDAPTTRRMHQPQIEPLDPKLLQRQVDGGHGLLPPVILRHQL